MDGVTKAIEMGDIDGLRKQLDLGRLMGSAIATTPDCQGNTPLQTVAMCAHMGRVDIAAVLLLRCGATVDSASLVVAAGLFAPEMVSLFLQHGIPHDARCQFSGESAADGAQRSLENVQLLLRKAREDMQTPGFLKVALETIEANEERARGAESILALLAKASAKASGDEGAPASTKKHKTC